MHEQPSEPESDMPVAGGGEPPAKEPVFNLPSVLVILMGLCVAVHVLRVFALSDEVGRWVLFNFAFFPARYDPAYLAIDFPTLVSPFSYAFLHGDWVHLGLNMIWLAIFGSPVAWRIGWGRSIAVWVVTALAAVGFHLALYFGDTVPLIGASGAVSGFLGASARFGLRTNRRSPRNGFPGPLLPPLQSLLQPGILPFLGIWMVINFVFGADIFGLAGGQSIAWEAHIGGLVAGFFAIAWLDRPNRAVADGR